VVRARNSTWRPRSRRSFVPDHHDPRVVRRWRRSRTFWRRPCPFIGTRAYDPTFAPWPTKRGMTLGMGMTGSRAARRTLQHDARDPRWRRLSHHRHKWFMSAPMCDAFLVLAQADEGLTVSSCRALRRMIGQRDGVPAAEGQARQPFQCVFGSRVQQRLCGAGRDEGKGRQNHHPDWCS